MAQIQKVIGLMSGTSLDGVDAALLVTRWPEFSKVTELLKPHQLLIDGRRMIEPQLVERYEGIGR